MEELRTGVDLMSLYVYKNFFLSTINPVSPSSSERTVGFEGIYPFLC
jgi:hypothetical protein